MNTSAGFEPCEMCGHAFHGLACINGIAPRDPGWERPATQIGCGCPGPWYGHPEAWLPKTSAPV